MNTKRWIVVFRSLANFNRLKIIKTLYDSNELNVTEISDIIKISLKATSNHLAMLKNLDVLNAHGKAGHVFYSFNQQLPEDFKKVIKLLL